MSSFSCEFVCWFGWNLACWHGCWSIGAHAQSASHDSQSRERTVLRWFFFKRRVRFTLLLIHMLLANLFSDWAWWCWVETWFYSFTTSLSIGWKTRPRPKTVILLIKQSVNQSIFGVYLRSQGYEKARNYTVILRYVKWHEVLQTKFLQ